jgi:hypothetical protein
VLGVFPKVMPAATSTAKAMLAAVYSAALSTSTNTRRSSRPRSPSDATSVLRRVCSKSSTACQSVTDYLQAGEQAGVPVHEMTAVQYRLISAETTTYAANDAMLPKRGI